MLFTYLIIYPFDIRFLFFMFDFVQRVMFFVFHLDPASITRQRMSNTTLTRLGRMNKNMSAHIMPLVPGMYEPGFTAVSHFSVNVKLLW
jgi:hypothetical protein